MTGRRSYLRTIGLMLAGAMLMAAVVAFVRTPLQGDTADPGLMSPITVEAEWSQEWQEGDAYIGIFRGRCRVIQGSTVFAARQMVIWSRQAETPAGVEDRLSVYLEDDVQVTSDLGNRTESSLLVELTTNRGVSLTSTGRITDHTGDQEPLYQRAVARQERGTRARLIQTQLTVDPLAPMNPAPENLFLPQPQDNLRRIRVFSRSAVPYNIESRQLTSTTPPEQVVVITGGVNFLIDGLDAELPSGALSGLQGMGMEKIGTVDLSADRVVVFTDAFGPSDFSPDMVQPRDAKYQIYLEGNIVVRQGNNVIRADRAFFDAREYRALILNADLRSELPEFGAMLRIRAERLQQLSQDNFHAQNAWVSTSQYGKPGYRLQSTDVFLEQRDWSPWGNQRPPEYDPITGEPIAERHPWVTTLNSTFLVDEVPLFYSPYASAPAEDPNIPLQGFNFSEDRIFGTQVRTSWDAFQLFGMQRPQNVKWGLQLDYLSRRGPVVGTNGNYRGLDPFGNEFLGNGLATYVNDGGTDNLGLGRRDLRPPDPNRGRLHWQHQHYFSNNLLFQGEAGYVSDRNYLEQYFENEFDRGKDQETLGYLKQQGDAWAWSLLARPQVNQFENNTQWMPRGDIYGLGEPLLGGLLNWSSHSMLGYAQLNQAKPPTDPQDIFTPLPYYVDAEGMVATSRHELEMPLDLGALNLTPYAMGEAAYWSDGFTSQSIDRLYGRAGVRANIMFTRIYPLVQNSLFNLNGLAHKVSFDADYSFADSSRDLSTIPQWNEFDDDAQERFRQRLVDDTFGGVLPGQLDPRFYAVRSGAGTSVTAPYSELVDSQQVLRFGWSHRLQTKVGPPDRQRIKDWLTFDQYVSYFPNAGRDNFDEDFGLFSTRLRWAVGDRTTVVANSLFDFFDTGQQLWNLGVQSQRSLRGSVYLGLRQIKAGPSLDSQILTASYSYAMSPKWVSTATTAYDLGEGRNRGQALSITRVGADFLIHCGLNYDASKNNVGVMLSLEPRLGSKNQLSSPQLGSLLGTGMGN